MTPENDAAEDPDEVRRRRVRFRCWHRGTKELDLLMGPFADRYLGEFTLPQLDQIEDLLTRPDLDLYNWITRREAIPSDADCEVLKLIIEFHNDR